MLWVSLLTKKKQKQQEYMYKNEVQQRQHASTYTTYPPHQAPTPIHHVIIVMEVRHPRQI